MLTERTERNGPGGAHDNMRGWSPEEDETLLRLIETSGKRWKLIAEALGNANPRTPAMVRNRWLRIERGRWLTEQGMSKNRCGQCGELKRGHVCRVARPTVTNSIVCPTPNSGAVPPPPSSGRSEGGQGAALALGGAQPLTMAFSHSTEDNGPSSVMSSPGPLSCGLSLGFSPLGTLGGTTPGGFPALGGPPSLRAQNSMDILLQASDLHRSRASEAVPTVTPLASEFDSNPFKLPMVSTHIPERAANCTISLDCPSLPPLASRSTSLLLLACQVSAADLPLELQTERAECSEAAASSSKAAKEHEGTHDPQDGGDSTQSDESSTVVSTCD